MDVYVEDVFLDNFVIDLVILFLTTKILGIKTNFWHLALCAIIGVGTVFLNLMFSLSGIALLIYKLLSGMAIVFALSPKQSIKKFFLTYTTFLFITFLFGGGVLMFALTFGQVVTTNGTISYSLDIPLWLILTIICTISWLFVNIFKAIKHKLCEVHLRFCATIFSNNKKLKIQAFLDTGNKLLDPQTHSPIFFITYKHFKKLYNVPLEEIILKKNIQTLKNCHYVSINTIGGQEKKILVFCVDKIILENPKQHFEILNATLGLTFSNLNKSIDAGLLVSPLALGV